LKYDDLELDLRTLRGIPESKQAGVKIRVHPKFHVTFPSTPRKAGLIANTGTSQSRQNDEEMFIL